MARLSRLTLPIGVLLHIAPTASADYLPLSDSLVTGRWEINSADSAVDGDSASNIRWVYQFSPDSTWESMLWLEESPRAGAPPAYVGVRTTGTWFIRDTLLGLVTLECQGFTGQGREECAAEAEELGDTGFAAVELRGGTRYLTPVPETIVAWPYRGADRDMTPPPFWPDSLPASLRPGRGVLRGAGEGWRSAGPVFDALGRRSAGTAAGRGAAFNSR